MVKVRTAKNKGASMEYDSLESLQQAFPHAYLTKQRGFQLMYDIQDDASKICVECKRHRNFTFNEIEKTFRKLREVSPKDYSCYVLIKPNHTDCYVAYVEPTYSQYIIAKFLDVFGVPFKKHTPIKKVNLFKEPKELSPSYAAELDGSSLV